MIIAWTGGPADLPPEDACLDCMRRVAVELNERHIGSHAARIPMEPLLRIVDAWLLQDTPGKDRSVLSAHMVGIADAQMALIPTY